MARKKTDEQLIELGYIRGISWAAWCLCNTYNEQEAEVLLAESNLSLADFKRAKSDPMDMKVIRPLLKEIERKRNLPHPSHYNKD